MTLEFNEAEHRYTLNGRTLPGVTQILNAVLPMFDVPEWYLTRGTATHYACQLLDENRLDWESVDDEIFPRVQAWHSFRKDYGGAIVANEKPMASERLQYAGKLDRVIARGNDIVICDLKNSFSPQNLLQLAAYSLLWKESGEKSLTGGVIVELVDDGTYRCHWLDRRELKRAEQQWQAVLTVFNFAKEHKLSRNK